MIKKESKKCTVCDYLNGFANISIKQHLNTCIYEGIKENEFNDECCNCITKNKIENNIKIPTYYFVKKHRIDCLKDFIPDIKKRIINKDVAKNKEDVIYEKPQLVYTDYSNYKPEEIPVILRTKMMDVACKLTDIALYRLEEYKNSIRSSNENIKDTLVSFKLIIDLFNIETNNYSDSEIKDKSIEELLESKSIVDLHLEILGDEKR